MTEHPELARAAADAAERGLSVEFVARTGEGPPADGMLSGVPIAKTIVVQRREEFVFVIAPLAAQFSWPKLRALLGVNKLSLPDADGAFDATGYPRGAITPLGAHTPWPVILDASLAGQRIALGTGAHGFGAIVDADALARAYDAEFAELSATAK
ncbi:aminoacyl-tRNA deacylase [Leucobacter chromiireducens]|uniref:YbaK/ebsC protein n=1 Tax=Leucobacter chromiireducens subsp. chromiireducens TaxID=660067 RepID=A0ABS1SR51_9MICO|nr:YbaK/EbsC family protein [Leucobacter chromiireducens]MBL3689612.1 ybaK/ebsC protein [Leucobacter chromiireducens subsp. chromiireducens]